jgi:hypothetical protein
MSKNSKKVLVSVLVSLFVLVVLGIALWFSLGCTVGKEGGLFCARLNPVATQTCTVSKNAATDKEFPCGK